MSRRMIASPHSSLSPLALPWLLACPLGSYLESEAELRLMRLESAVALAFKPFRTSAAFRASESARARLPPHSAVEYLGGLRPTDAGAARRCVRGSTYGGVELDGTPLVWIDGGCWGVFRCRGVVLQCGQKWPPPRFSKCICLPTNSLEASRHYFDGARRLTAPRRARPCHAGR